MKGDKYPEVHDLKTWPAYFQAIVEGRKTFELRKNDRSFNVGDTLHLREFDAAAGQYTGREAKAKVTYMIDAVKVTDLLKVDAAGFCVMSIELTQIDDRSYPSSDVSKRGGSDCIE